MSVRELRPQLQERAKKELNEDPARRDADLTALKEWLKKQPHIVAKPDDQMLMTFLRGCKFSLEKAKKKLDMYYTVRTAVPELFQNRNVRDPKIKDMIKNPTCFPLPGLDPEGRRVVIYRPGIPDASKHNLQDYVKMNFMVMDVLMQDDDDLVISGMVNLIDITGVSMSLATQFNPILAKKIFVTSQEGYPIRPKSVNYVNVPSFVTPFVNLAKSFTNEKMRKRLYVHGDNKDTLYKEIPKEILPTEYGGFAGSMQQMSDDWWAKMDSYYDWLIGPAGTAGVDERKRPGKPKTQQDLFGLEGSFRQLDLD